MRHDTIHRLVYVSSAVRPVPPGEVAGIIAVSRRNNGPQGLTGVLLSVEDAYFQALEGPKAAVAQTYDRIARDERHRGLITLSDGPVTERQFPDWTMGALTAHGAALPDGARRIRDGASVEAWMVSLGDGVMLRFIETFFRINNSRARFA